MKTTVIDEIKKVIVGKDEIIKKVLMAILAKGHILLEDIPGVGKTTLAITMSKVMGLDYKRIQFTPDVMPSDIVGFSMYSKKHDEFRYNPGAVMCNLLLGDEINRTPSKTQSALLEVMEEGNVTVDGITHPLPKPFIVIATQNPIGTSGTYQLPLSQLDRFMIKLRFGYPDFKAQVNILRDRQKEQPLDKIDEMLSREDIVAMQNEVADIFVSDAILEYISYLAVKSRDNDLIEVGISPRGALAMSKMAKANAYIKGRDYVTPEDIIEIFIDVCSHRIILSSKAKILKKSPDTVLQEFIENTKTPDVYKLEV